MASLTELLFHTPFWFPILILAVGSFVFYSGNTRQEPRTRLAGGIIILLAVALTAVSYFVDTDLEKAVKQSRQVVAAVETSDWPTMQRLLDRNCSLDVLNAFTLYRSRDKIIDAAKIAVQRYGLKAAHITSIKGEQAGGLITVSFDVFTEQDATLGRPIPSGWQFEWIKSPEGWVLNRIVNVKVANETGQGAVAQFPRP